MTKKVTYDAKLIKDSIIYSFLITCLIWLVRGVELITNQSFAHFGLKPRNFKGLVGVFTGPFIHNNIDLSHIWSNTIPLFVLSGLTIYLFNRIAYKVIIGIWFITGFWVWILGQTGSYHIGASGIIYGLLSFLLVSGFIRKNKAGIALALMLVISYGTMFWGLFPLIEGISWESHLMGFVSGAVLSFYYKDELMYGQHKISISYSSISFSNPEISSYKIHYKPNVNDDIDSNLNEN